MTKKYLILSVTLLLATIVSFTPISIKAATCASTLPPNCSAGTGCGAGLSCQQLVVGCSCLAAPSGGSGDSGTKLNDCFKIGSDFSVSLMIDNTGKVESVNFKKGALVGSRKDIDKDTCSHITDNTKIDTKCSGDIAKTAKCFPLNSNEFGIIGMLNVVYNVTNWMFYIMGILAVLMVVYGGLIYITAAGDPSTAGKGKTILIYSMIGLAIALVAKLIPNVVKFIVGM